MKDLETLNPRPGVATNAMCTFLAINTSSIQLLPVTAVAVLAVSARGLAQRLSAGREGGGVLVMRGIEFAAAGLVLLFGLGLYARYQADPEGFKAVYDDLLSSTGLGDASELAAGFGIDIRSVDFWRSSLDVVRGDIERFEALANQSEK